MSVYGGDSWAREAQHRKRNVDDLMIERIDSSIYKKLSSGKFACLVCPTNPVLDSPTMLSTHVSGSQHQAAELRRKSRELAKQEEVKKRLALSGLVSAKAPAIKQLKSTSKPLIEQARKAVFDAISGSVAIPEVMPTVANLGRPFVGDNGSNADGVVREVQPLNYRLRQERELKFTAAGWIRDCHGRWFKDENVEFDSDEEDPNIVLNEST
ncbi:sodium channel modifier 1-like [Salvia hispanica]|uniref:sodium channel modifier 1-like n=1 Tax=Salvia hispanica TaxID=49212 RepID=UPI002009A5DB|nr:sodium channel modifier 1-like [Salvia hispanica]XP_047983443.1 sodium channel modifier 1-like [Salvia hispanica]XP_047983444.1 sodium channel modifier 1-like [Salvia hispanica]